MGRQATILRVFVASPKDLAEERAALESVIRELNNTWSNTLGTYLELLKWETHAYPTSVVTAKAASCGHLKTGQLRSRLGQK